jgi:hypothetical protein
MTNPVVTESVTVLTGMYQAEAEYLAAGGRGRPRSICWRRSSRRNVTLHQADALPYGGVWRGHAGSERFFWAMGLGVVPHVEQEFLATGGTAVVLTRVRARARAAGRELEFPILQQITVRDG